MKGMKLFWVMLASAPMIASIICIANDHLGFANYFLTLTVLYYLFLNEKK
jgi:hypothetical protein